MADIKPYERYKKDRSTQPKKHNIENYSDFQKALLSAVEKQTAPQKPVKWFALSRMWRYEQPQAGRLREFYQLSAELFGSSKRVILA